LHWRDELLETIAFPAGTMRITRGLGSGLARCARDAPGLFWAVGDRGPNIKLKVAIKDYGLNALTPHANLDGAKVMVHLAHGPALSQVRLTGDHIEIVRTLALRGPDGKAISGLAPPNSPHAEFEPMFAIDGTDLGTDPSGIDSEALAVCADGSFWIGEEYGPSLLKVARDGTVEMRWVPAGTEGFYTGAVYPVAGALPAARRLNRGFEALALSTCERFLYVMFQSPLAHPNRDAHARSAHVRVWKLDTGSGALIAEYLYPLDKPDSFKRDSAKASVDRADIKISEILMLDDASLLVLERVSASTKLYAIALAPAFETPVQFLNPSMRPTLEQLTPADLKTAGVPVLDKRLIFSTDTTPEISADLEGMILLSPRELLLVNDNDFGVEGAETAFWRVRLESDIAAKGG
jgi:hypothetical protein